MHYAFQDRDNLYLVMDLLNGGDLRYHISRYRKFSEEQTRFFIANIIYAIEYIHSNNVIHRDIKPENLVLDENGYVRITDFGIAKENMPDNSSETSGTPGYMAPEVMKGRNHSFPVDFFAIGVIGYEFMIGSRPYCGKNRKEIKEQMLSKAVIINEDILPSGWSKESADFINKLLERKDNKRLGYKEGAKELMKHHWLKYYPWDELKNKSLLAPFIPDPNDNFDKNYCESIDKISEETKSRYEEIYSSAHFKKIFVDFYFDTDEMRKIKKEKEQKDKLMKEEKDKKEQEKNLYKNSSLELDNKNKNDKNNNYINNEKNLSNKIENNNIDNINHQQINNSSNINNNKSNTIKNIRVNRINNFVPNDNNINISNNRLGNNKIYSLNNNTKKELESNTNKTNVIQKKDLAYKKPLSHSNSTKEIYSNNNIERYLKLKQGQLTSQKKANKNQNIYRQKKNFGNNMNGDNKFNKVFSSKNGANININNYYTNNIFNAIYNSFMPRQNYEKKIEDKKYKKIGQRASSVFYQKRPISKSKLERNKNKIDKENNLSNKLNYKSKNEK